MHTPQEIAEAIFDQGLKDNFAAQSDKIPSSFLADKLEEALEKMGYSQMQRKVFSMMAEAVNLKIVNADQWFSSAKQEFLKLMEGHFNRPEAENIFQPANQSIEYD